MGVSIEGGSGGDDPKIHRNIIAMAKPIAMLDKMHDEKEA